MRGASNRPSSMHVDDYERQKGPGPPANKNVMSGTKGAGGAAVTNVGGGSAGGERGRTRSRSPRRTTSGGPSRSASNIPVRSETAVSARIHCASKRPIM